MFYPQQPRLHPDEALQPLPGGPRLRGAGRRLIGFVISSMSISIIIIIIIIIMISIIIIIII